jgi:hypothetical protein
MGITVKIAGVDRTEYVDARSLHTLDELTSRVNSASFAFICNDITLAPIDGQAVLIEQGTTKLFSGRILTKEEDFLPPNLLKYQVECIDNTRDLDKKLVTESYIDTLAGNIIKDIIDKYTTGFTYVHVSDGPTIVKIAFDYIQVSEAITKIAECCGYQWYCDYNKNIYFFEKNNYPSVQTKEVTFISTASDGDVYIFNLYENGATYKQVHDAAEGEVVVDDVDNACVGQEEHSGFAIWRSFLFFDTSSIPENAVIVSAKLSLWFLWDYSDTDFNVVIRNGMPNYPHDPLVLGDYHYGHYSGNGGQVNTEGISTSQYTDIELKSIGRNWIQKGNGAVTKFALISSRDISATEPNADSDEDISFYTYGKGSTRWPKLIITYYIPFRLDDNQYHYKDLVINTDISQLRNRVYVKSSKYETLDFTELFIGDGSTVTWACKYQANALPAPSLKLNGASKTVGWDGVDNPDDYDFMLNASTKVLFLGTYQPTPANGDEIVITYGADVPIIIRWDDQDSIDAVKAIEGGDGIFEHCITDNNIDTKEWAIDRAKADLLQNANPVIEGNFITNRSDIKSGQIITLNSTKRNINQNFLVQRVELIRVDVNIEYAKVPYKPAATATIGYKPAADAEIPYRAVEGREVIYYVYQVTIATKLKGLEDLLLQLLYQSSESLKRDTEAPDVPTGLALSTGMGSITQASLAWLKATWNANAEDDFSHYELKYKKTAYSDFGLVTTTNTSFIWTGLEQNIEYEVYIRSVDIYGNRSAWSSQVTQTTATDSDIPDQVTGATAEAILAGIKIIWTGATEGNIAGYIVERQESDNGTDWTANWIERVRLDAYMWLDLLLTYTKYYRYRITAYTQSGTEGTTSTPTADSIAPLKTGANDIVAKCITTDQIYGTNLAAIFADLGTITAGNITLNTAGFIRSDGKTYGGATAGFWMGYNVDKYKLHIGTNIKYLKWDGAALTIKGVTTTDSLSALNANLGTITAGNITINSSGFIRSSGKDSYTDTTAGFWMGYSSGYKLNIGNANKYLKWNGSSLTIKGMTTTDSLAAISATLGSVSAGNIQGTRLQIGGGTDEDIYFEDSGVRMYDFGTRHIRFFKSGYAGIDFSLASSAYSEISSTGRLSLKAPNDYVVLTAASSNFYCRSLGVFSLPNLGSNPSGYTGGICMVNNQLKYWNGSAWINA